MCLGLLKAVYNAYCFGYGMLIAIFVVYYRCYGLSLYGAFCLMPLDKAGSNSGCGVSSSHSNNGNPIRHSPRKARKLSSSVWRSRDPNPTLWKQLNPKQILGIGIRSLPLSLIIPNESCFDSCLFIPTDWFCISKLLRASYLG